MQVELTAPQLARLARVPKGSVAYYVAMGLLRPGVWSPEVRGHLFGFVDLIVAKLVTQLRLSSSANAGTRDLADFWHTPEGSRVLEGISHEAEHKTWGEFTSSAPVVVLLADGKGSVEQNGPILEITRRLNAPVVHVVDVALLVAQATRDVMAAMASGELAAPGDGGPHRVVPPTDGAAARRHTPRRIHGQPVTSADVPAAEAATPVVPVPRAHRRPVPSADIPAVEATKPVVPVPRRVAKKVAKKRRP